MRPGAIEHVGVAALPPNVLIPVTVLELVKLARGARERTSP